MATTDARLRLVITAQDQTGRLFDGLADSAKRAAQNINDALSSAGGAASPASSAIESATSTIKADLQNLADTIGERVRTIQSNWDGIRQLEAPHIAGLLMEGAKGISDDAEKIATALRTIMEDWGGIIRLQAPHIAGLLTDGANSIDTDANRVVDAMSRIKNALDTRQIPDTVYGRPPSEAMQMIPAGPSGVATTGPSEVATTGGGAGEAFKNVGDAARKASESLADYVTKTKLSRDEAQQLIGVLAQKTGNFNILQGAATGTNSELAKFIQQVTGVKVSVADAIPELTAMEKVMALQGLAQASEMIKGWGESVLGFLGDATRLSADFETKTVNLQSALALNEGLMGAGADAARYGYQGLEIEMNQLSDKATDLGKAFMFNENDIQGMFAQMASSGIPAKAMLDGVGLAAVQLAQATNSELLPTSKVLTSTFHQMGDSLAKSFGSGTLDQMQGATDVLTNIQLTTHESLQSISSTMKYVGPIANEAGVSFKELGTAMALLGRNGIDASMAGTGLRRMFTNLTPQSQEAEDAMRQLGIITTDGANQFYDAQGKMRPLREVMDVLNKSTAGLGDAQKTAALKAIFGQYALQSMMVMAKTSVGEFDSLAQKIGQTGTAAAISARQMGTTAGMMDVMGENWQIIKKKIGDALEQALKPLMAVFIQITDVVISFMKTHPQVVQWLSTFAAIAGVVLAVVGAVGGFIATIGMFATALEAGATALGIVEFSLGALLGPVALVVAAIVGLYVAFQTNFGGIRDFVMAIWNYLKVELVAAWEYISPTVMAAIKKLWDFFKQFIDGIGVLLAFVITVIKQFEPLWTAAWDTIKALLKTAWDAITGIISGAFDIVKGAWDVFIGIFTGDWERAWNGLKDMLGGVWKLIETGVSTAWELIKVAIKTPIEVILALFDTNFGTSLLDKFKTWFANVETAITNIWTGLVNSAKDWGSNMISMFGDGIMNKLSSLKEKVSSAASSIKSFLGFSSPTEQGPGANADQWAPNFMKMFASGITEHQDKVRTAMNGVAMDMKTTVGIDGKGAVPVPSSRASGSAPVFNITINSNGRGGDELAQEFVGAIRRYVPVVTVT